jgi:lysophospholipase
VSQGASHEQSLFVDGPRGWKIHGRHWLVSNPKGTFVGVHGYSEHSGRYAHFARYLNSQGWDVYWIDLPGHGMSEGARNDIDDFSDYVLSVEHFVREIGRRSAKRPIHLFGHSLGGLVAIRFIETFSAAHSMASLILSGPLLGLDRFDPMKLYFLRVVASLLPNIRLKNKRELTGPYLTKDQEILADRARDPLINSHVTFHWFREFCRGQELAFSEVEKIHLPVLMLMASEERVVCGDSIRRFFGQLMSTQKELLEYKGMQHEVLNEIGREKVFDDIMQWMSRT